LTSAACIPLDERQLVEQPPSGVPLRQGPDRSGLLLATGSSSSRRLDQISGWDVPASIDAMLGGRIQGNAGWKSRAMADHYAKHATEHLAVAAARIENGRGGNVIQLSTFSLRRKKERASG